MPNKVPNATAFKLLLALMLGFAASSALAWGNHSVAAYRALENLPEVAKAPAVVVEPLEAFLKAQEKPIEALLKAQEDWAVANITAYPPRPATLAFKADAGRSDEARRAAFQSALRIAADSRFALFYELDPGQPTEGLSFLRHVDVSTLPGLPNAPRRFVGLTAGEPVAALKVVASAAFEPDYGLDINVWDDSPSAWGKTYGFGKLPFGNPKLNFSTQAPFHMGFYHEDKILYLAAPFLKRTFPMLRVNQYAGLAALAFRTGHSYWGWRFAGLALHYVQDLTQPYHASLAPGTSTLALLWTNALSMAGFPKMREETVTLLSNRHLALENYQGRALQATSAPGKPTPAGQALNKALGNLAADAQYPAWSDTYLRDVIAKEAYASGARLAKTLVETMPAGYVSDPGFDFGSQDEGIDLVTVLGKQEATKRDQLDATLVELLTRYGAHSRNAVRGILKAAGK
jgi:hypothetical protein